MVIAVPKESYSDPSRLFEVPNFFKQISTNLGEIRSHVPFTLIFNSSLTMEDHNHILFVPFFHSKSQHKTDFQLWINWDKLHLIRTGWHMKVQKLKEEWATNIWDVLECSIWQISSAVNFDDENNLHTSLFGIVFFFWKNVCQVFKKIWYFFCKTFKFFHYNFVSISHFPLWHTICLIFHN